jgi:alginate O-acetyltransferase complex protein AlgI
MLTMMLGGLWHGANWTYLIWGTIHGLLLVGHRQFRAEVAMRPRLSSMLDSWVGTIVRVMLTYVSVSLCWVMFQPDWSKALAMYQRMFGLYTGQTFPLHNRSLWYTVLFVIGCHLILARGYWQIFWERAPAMVIGAGYAVCLTAAMVLAPATGKSFIYFTF